MTKTSKKRTKCENAHYAFRFLLRSHFILLCYPPESANHSQLKLLLLVVVVDIQVDGTERNGGNGMRERERLTQYQGIFAIIEYNPPSSERNEKSHRKL